MTNMLRQVPQLDHEPRSFWRTLSDSPAGQVALIDPFMSLFRYSSAFRSGAYRGRKNNSIRSRCSAAQASTFFVLMGPQPIHDQEDLSGRLAQHSLQERNKQCGRHRLFVGHEVDRSLVANRRDQVHADVGIGHLDPRRPPLRGRNPVAVAGRPPLPVSSHQWISGILTGGPPFDRRIGAPPANARTSSGS